MEVWPRVSSTCRDVTCVYCKPVFPVWGWGLFLGSARREGDSPPRAGEAELIEQHPPLISQGTWIRRQEPFRPLADSRPLPSGRVVTVTSGFQAVSQEGVGGVPEARLRSWLRSEPGVGDVGGEGTPGRRVGEPRTERGERPGGRGATGDQPCSRTRARVSDHDRSSSAPILIFPPGSSVHFVSPTLPFPPGGSTLLVRHGYRSSEGGPCFYCKFSQFVLSRWCGASTHVCLLHTARHCYHVLRWCLLGQVTDKRQFS